MSTRAGLIRLATRGSDLALRQARAVQSGLEGRRHSVELVTVETKGDEIRDELIHRLGTTGAFVRALDERVLDGDVDGAVHSMKDVPTEGGEELIVAAVPQRANPGDLLVTPDGTALDDLPEGATVGTSSLRRKAQLLARRPDLRVEPLRGNVDTRIEKLLAPHLQREYDRRVEAAREQDEEDEEEFDLDPEEWRERLTDLGRRALERTVEREYDAIVLAAAGLERAELLGEAGIERLPPTEFVPAPGQGALAVTMRDTDLAEAVHDRIDHPRTRVETTVERTILATLGGGCVAPLGAHAVIRGEYVHATARVLSEDGSEEVRMNRDLPIERHARAAREMAEELADRGGRELIETARRETEDDAGRRSEDEE